MRADELCAPARRDDEDVVDADTHLLCFTLQRFGVRPGPRTVYATDQLRSSAVLLRTSKQRLCLPSAKTVLP
jgi:hypothetical protein